MKDTGVFATTEEVSKLQASIEAIGNTPYLLGTGGRAPDYWHNLQQEAHKIALSHGLPEITGFYGMKGSGEFVEVD